MSAPPWRRLTRWPVALAAMAAAPLLGAAARGVLGGWYPIGDNAFFALRALDVGTEHNPLLGTWTSASLTVDRRLNNPGPLLFDWLALPTRLDVAWGTVLGVVLLHLVVVVVAITWAHRTAGPAGAAAVAAGFLALQWAMGSEILVEPWQPHSLLPAALAYLVLIWAIVAGHPGALPWAAAVASLVLQTHLSYGIIVPGLAILAVGSLLVRARSGAQPLPLRRPLLLSAAVVAVSWAQPLYDQLFGSGNLVAVVVDGGGGDELAGPGFAARVLASVGAVPGGWGPDGFSRLTVDLLAERAPGEPPALEGLASTGAAIGWGAAAVAALVAACAVAWRRRDSIWAGAVLVAAVALVLAFVTVAVLPVSPVLGVAAHQVRPVWPVVLFTLTAILGALLTRWRWAVGALAAAAAVLAVLALPARNPATGPSADAWAIPYVRDLVSQLDAVEGVDLVLVDLSVIRFAEPYSTPVMLELERRGVEFVTDDEIAIGQLGERRAATSSRPADLELRVVDGQAAAEPEPGWQRIAYVAGPSARETAAVLVRPAR